MVKHYNVEAQQPAEERCRAVPGLSCQQHRVGMLHIALVLQQQQGSALLHRLVHAVMQ